MRSIVIILAALAALTACATDSGPTSMGPGTHKLDSTYAGTWRATGSKSCKWTLSYKQLHNAPVKHKSGAGYNPVVTIGAWGVRFTSDNCGTFKK